MKVHFYILEDKTNTNTKKKNYSAMPHYIVLKLINYSNHNYTIKDYIKKMVILIFL